MSELTSTRPLRRRLFGGYRHEDVEILLAELRLENQQLAQTVEGRWRRIRELEGELAGLRSELEGRRAKEYELAQAMTSAHRRATEIEEAAESRARSIVTEAEDKAARIRSDAVMKTEELSRQVDELMRLKDDMVRSMRGVIRDFDHVVTRIDRGESLLAAPGAAAATERAAAAPAPPASTAPAAPVTFGLPQPQPGARAEATPLPPGAAEHVFDARVELDAGPFSDFATLSAFERALARLPKVEDVYIRRFSNDRAVIELTLSEPAALLRAMSEFLPYTFAVEAADRARLIINVQVPSAAPAT